MSAVRVTADGAGETVQFIAIFRIRLECILGAPTPDLPLV